MIRLRNGVVTLSQNGVWLCCSAKFVFMASADRLYRRILAYARFFSKGWGPVDTYEKLLDYRHILFSRQGCVEILQRHPQKVTIKKVKKIKEGVIYDGEFFSPLAAYLPGMLPKESEVARFEMILPHTWRDSDRPVYIHLAGTGDHYYWRRRVMTVLPTLRASGIGGVSLENPYYGSRKPPEQTRSQLQHVSDLFVLGMALILECMVIMHWLEEKGLGPVGLTGYSMGGHNCSLAAALWPKAVAVVPCLSWSTASSSFTEGLLSRTVCWNVLHQQLQRSHNGRDERMRECFRRIRDLETNTAHTNNHYIHSMNGVHVGHPRTVSVHSGHSGIVSELMTSSEASSDGSWSFHRASSPLGSDTLSQSVLLPLTKNEGVKHGGEKEKGGLRKSALQHDSITTASIHGTAHILQQVLACAGRKIRTEITDRRKQFQSNDHRMNLPRPEILNTMRIVLDSSTHHQNFPIPIDPSLAHFVTAEEDEYIPRGNITDVHSLWKGCDVEYITGGHISATILKQGSVHKALNTTIQRVYM